MTAPTTSTSARPVPIRNGASSVTPGQAQNGGAMTAGVASGPYNPLKSMIPLRDAPDAPDRFDPDRIASFTIQYQNQTNALLVRDRQIEYNVRMLCGQQWNVWHPTLGRFFDISDWMTNDEKAWRKLPVINKLLRWFIITHSRLTENPPILTVLPGPDRIDAELAEVTDQLLKKDWRDAGMEAVHDELMTWVVVAGRGYAVSRIDPNKGDWRPWVGSAQLPLVGPDGLPMLDTYGNSMLTPQPVPNVPINADGSPNAYLGPNGQMVALGPPHMERSGGVAVDVYSPLQVRGQWGPQLWHKKRWHGLQRFLTPEQVYEAWKVEVEPDISEQAAANIATLERVLWGNGFYGQTMGRLGTGWTDSRVKGALCTVYERWEAPLPFDERLQGTTLEGMIETPSNPGGRHTVWTPKAMIVDGPREVAWPNVSPIRCFDFVRLPGRPTGTTPLEMLLGPQRAYNSSRAQVMEQAALLGNPQVVVDSQAGIQASQLTNEPGKIYTADKRPGVSAVEYVAAPGVSPDVLKSIQFASEEIDELGGLHGTEGQAPTADASGALVSELRYNADRLLGATARRNVSEYGRMGDDWRALYPLIYPTQTVIAVTGQDGLAETITVLPLLFQQGHAHIVPDAESMLPEGRGERQQRAYVMYKDGLFGDPASNEAKEIFLEQSRFPNYSRLSRPGGVDRATAEQENGKILTGQFQQPVLPWYDHAIHLATHERYMKSPEFLKQPPIVQKAFAIHRQLHIQALAAQTMPPAPPPNSPAGRLMAFEDTIAREAVAGAEALIAKVVTQTDVQPALAAVTAAVGEAAVHGPEAEHGAADGHRGRTAADAPPHHGRSTESAPATSPSAPPAPPVPSSVTRRGGASPMPLSTPRG